MVLSEFSNWIKKEFQVLTGNKGKNKQCDHKHVYGVLSQAESAFERSKQKLFNVNAWSNMEGINSKFSLYDHNGQRCSGSVQKGFFIRIELPASKIEKWVHVTDMRNELELAEFIVHPSKKPEEKSDPNAEVQHFFTAEASSTFRVVRKKNVIEAFEIGRNEIINNQGAESGDRSILNTLIAEGAWAGFQKIQWDKLTKYLVHLNEVERKK